VQSWLWKATFSGSTHTKKNSCSWFPASYCWFPTITIDAFMKKLKEAIMTGKNVQDMGDNDDK
jgi:hypothetical protein